MSSRRAPTRNPSGVRLWAGGRGLSTIDVPSFCFTCQQARHRSAVTRVQPQPTATTRCSQIYLPWGWGVWTNPHAQKCLRRARFKTILCIIAVRSLTPLFFSSSRRRKTLDQVGITTVSDVLLKKRCFPFLNCSFPKNQLISFIWHAHSIKSPAYMQIYNLFSS